MIAEEETNEDENLRLSYCKRRHLTYSNAGDLNYINKNWRMKERVSRMCGNFFMCIEYFINQCQFYEIHFCFFFSR